MVKSNQRKEIRYKIVIQDSFMMNRRWIICNKNEMGPMILIALSILYGKI